MIFNVIGLLLLASSLPLWLYRARLVAALDARSRTVFKRLLKRHEPPLVFGAKLFALLMVLTGLMLLIVYALAYFKHGAVYFKSYRDVVRNRLYSGMESIDPHLDAFLYDQIPPVMIVITCLLLAGGVTLFMTALRDIELVTRLRKRLEKLQKRTENMP